MADNQPRNQESPAANRGANMRLFIFKSDADPSLGAFCDELAGLQLPSKFAPWRAVGAVAPDSDPPHRLSRDVIETAINERGFQLFRMSKKEKD